MQKRLLSYGKEKVKKQSKMPANVQVTTDEFKLSQHIYHQSASFENFAALLLINLFKVDDMYGKNCNGYKKPKLDMAIQDKILYLVYTFFPREMEENPWQKWRHCQIMMDERLRRPARKNSKYRHTGMKLAAL